MIMYVDKEIDVLNEDDIDTQRLELHPYLQRREDERQHQKQMYTAIQRYMADNKKRLEIKQSKDTILKLQQSTNRQLDRLKRRQLIRARKARKTTQRRSAPSA